MPCVRVVGIHKRTTPSRVLPDAELPFFHGGVQVVLEDRSTASVVQVKFVASKWDQRRAGCTITPKCLEKETETGLSLIHI